MNLYKCTNKAGNRILVVAVDESSCKDIAVKLRHAKKESNVRVKDITQDYTQHYTSSGFTMPVVEGQLLQQILPGTSRWVVIEPPME